MTYTQEQLWQMDAKCAELMGWKLFYDGPCRWQAAKEGHWIGRWGYDTWSPTTNKADALELAEHLGISLVRHGGEWHAIKAYLQSRVRNSVPDKSSCIDFGLTGSRCESHESPCMAVVLCALAAKEMEAAR